MSLTIKRNETMAVVLRDDVDLSIVLECPILPVLNILNGLTDCDDWTKIAHLTEFLVSSGYAAPTLCAGEADVAYCVSFSRSLEKWTCDEM